MTKKRFFVTLVLSFLVWFVSIFVQAFTAYNAPLTLLGSGCQLTGFPVALCIYTSDIGAPFWSIHILNVVIWFWVIHFFWGFFSKKKTS
ncbi:hypothetical protein A2631_03345 [Candidatus Daviesbacteria bacterium RIFCSPHIGHO2_01_FULL_44_29]|uniref:Uncharacterized protein n=1 Tax=Candidatus Daviesbacteria bacterium RIFCSPHIGHO2_02_FULL_43_12 TaxID=1797776 RepID=A0A1F5KKF5_9BACT|nr:MAG: hypothetical protein A2631_03345 [Candidatus Daviesbacteria bacterium RIFCSPHIGHO2_01_FULL_44_29]OGE41417.1 MAG: hypothetical protein A3D25_02740 [Candidatus Daviesbacteria bacterium RIFCSPHIGHO2_02_FULL_43_12]OGE69617.1 MAG: hypothetical protein A3B55_04485 [Candidatus Daviesbacteria bacterium RIFCSPLOWO2_01_FULL_43_15]